MAIGASLLLLVATAVSGMEGTLFGIPGNISQCTVGCIAASGSHDGCRPPIDTKCVCGNPLFTQVALPCVEDQCTADDVDMTLQLYVDFCVSSSSVLAAAPGITAVTESFHVPPFTFPLSIIPLPSFPPHLIGTSTNNATAMGVTATTSNRSSIQVSGSASAPMSTSQPASVLFHTSHTTPPMDPSSKTPSEVSTESATSVISKPGQESGITLTFPSAGICSPSSSEPTVDVTQSIVTYSPMPSSTNKGDSAGRNAAIRRNFRMTTLALFSILAMQVVPLFF